MGVVPSTNMHVNAIQDRRVLYYYKLNNNGYVHKCNCRSKYGLQFCVLLISAFNSSACFFCMSYNDMFCDFLLQQSWWCCLRTWRRVIWTVHVTLGSSPHLRDVSVVLQRLMIYMFSYENLSWPASIKGSERLKNREDIFHGHYMPSDVFIRFFQACNSVTRRVSVNNIMYSMYSIILWLCTWFLSIISYCQESN